MIQDYPVSEQPAWWLVAQEALGVAAAAVLFPIKWCEPFGLVAVEAQASGTPIIATRYGALPEIIREGETGFVVDSVEHAVLATEKLGSIDICGSTEMRPCRKPTVVMSPLK